MLYLVFLILIDIVIVAGISIGVGAMAPRWHGAWLTNDFGPLHFAPWESPKFFRALKPKNWRNAFLSLAPLLVGQQKINYRAGTQPK